MILRLRADWNTPGETPARSSQGIAQETMVLSYVECNFKVEELNKTVFKEVSRPHFLTEAVSANHHHLKRRWMSLLADSALPLQHTLEDDSPSLQGWFLENTKRYSVAVSAADKGLVPHALRSLTQVALRDLLLAKRKDVTQEHLELCG